MAEEARFKIDQTVYFRPQRSIAPVAAPSGRYRITRRFRQGLGEFEYAIRSDYENHDRIARESELTRPK
jgi:hypothetical protein